MNNQVAASCCGSCGKAGYNSGVLFCGVSHTSRKPWDICPQAIPRQDYSPRNPIPIIDIPGVKEMVEKAYRAGAKERRLGYHHEVNDVVDEYMKALEDKR